MRHGTTGLSDTRYSAKGTKGIRYASSKARLKCATNICKQQSEIKIRHPCRQSEIEIEWAWQTFF